jgi:hypothetical protein
VDYTGRFFRAEKAALAREVAEILARLGSSADCWQAWLEKLRDSRLLARFFASRRKRLKDVAGQLGLRRVPNLTLPAY